MTRVAERGTAGLAVTWWGLVVLALALAGLAGGVDLATTQARARTAADAAALAGAGAHPLAGGGGDMCAAAARLAAANDARLASCRVTGRRAARLRVAVRVTSRPASHLLRTSVGPASATAVAGLSPARSAPGRRRTRWGGGPDGRRGRQPDGTLADRGRHVGPAGALTRLEP